MTQKITTERLVLRPFQVGDAPAIVRLLDNLAVARWLTMVPQPYAQDDALAFIDASAAAVGPVRAILCEDTLIGCMSILSELGYWLGEPYWGRGYATEAGRAMVADYFARTQEPLKSGYHLGNAGSQNVLTKLGFLPTDTRQAQSLAMARDVTIQNMELTHNRWAALQ